MPHGIAQAVKDQLANDNLNLATLIQFNSDTVLRFADYGSNIRAFNYVFVPSEFLVSMGDVSESSSLQVGSFKLTLSAVDTDFLEIALNNKYIGIKVQIWRAVLSGGEVVGVPWSVFEGQIKGFQLSEKGNKSEISFDVASHWADFEKVNCRRTNGNSQRRYFPNDTGLDFSAKAVKEQKWGRL